MTCNNCDAFFAQNLNISLSIFLLLPQMWFHCSPRSAATVVGVKSGSRTPSSSWRSWRRSMQPANSSPKTREGASRPPPTSRSARSPSGSRTGESRRRNLSVNPRAITCTPPDEARDVPTAARTFHNTTSSFYLLRRKSRGRRTFFGRVGSCFVGNLSSIVSIDHATMPPPSPLQAPCFQLRDDALKTVKILKISLHVCFIWMYIYKYIIFKISVFQRQVLGVFLFSSFIFVSNLISKRTDAISETCNWRIQEQDLVPFWCHF